MTMLLTIITPNNVADDEAGQGTPRDRSGGNIFYRIYYYIFYEFTFCGNEVVKGDMTGDGATAADKIYGGVHHHGISEINKWMKKVLWGTPCRKGTTITVALAGIITGIIYGATICGGFRRDGKWFHPCYIPSHELLDYQQAVEWCKEHHGAVLVAFTSPQQYSYVTEELRELLPDRVEYKEYWIAGTYQDEQVTLPRNITPYVRWKNGAPYGRNSSSQPASSSMNKMVLDVRCTAKNKENGMFNSDPTEEFRPLCVRCQGCMWRPYKHSVQSTTLPSNSSQPSRLGSGLLHASTVNGTE